MRKRVAIINIYKAKLYLIYFLMFLYFFIPPISENILSIKLISIIKMLSYFFVAIYIVFNFKKISYTMFLIIFFNISLIFSTLINKGELLEAIKHALIVIAICLIINDIIDNNVKLMSFIHVIRDLSLIVFIINIILFIIYPTGIPSITYDSEFPNFLYGNVNSTIKHILPGMCCSSIIDYKNGKKFSLWTLIFFFGVFYQAMHIYFTATAVFNCIFIIIWIYFINKYKNIDIRKIYLLSVLIIFILEIMLVFRLKLITHFSDLIGKDFDFNGRIFLWENVIRAIVKKVFFGYGLVSDSFLVYLIGNFYGAHNYFLDIFFQRGIIGLFLLILIILYPISIKKFILNSDIVKILFGYTISCLILFLTEPIYTKEFLIIPIIYSLLSSVERISNKQVIK